MFSFRSAIAILLAVTTQVAVAADNGSYWAIYNQTVADASADCLKDVGEAVDMACCEAETAAISPHSDLIGDTSNTCLLFGPGFVGPFTGCNGDGVYQYGENCNETAVVADAPFEAASADTCGCSFKIEGTGCFKANDLPGQSWFVYLDGDSCKTSAGSTASTICAMVFAFLLVTWM